MVPGNIPTAGEWMSEVRLKLRREDSIVDAIHQLSSLKVAAAVVTDDADQLVGMLTEKDCLRLVTRTAYENHLQDGTVGDYMSEAVSVLEPTMDLFRAAEVFISCNFPTLPVVEQGRVVGRLSRHDMLRCVEKYLDATEQARLEEMRLHEQSIKRPRGIEEMQQTAAQNSPDRLARLFSRNR